MSQNYTWPAISVTATNPSVGTNGTTIPGSSTQVGGRLPSGNLSPVQLDNSLNLLVSVAASVLPTGGATAANQVIMIADLAAIQTSVASLDSKTVHVDTGNVTVVSSVLPTGGATSAFQVAGNTSLASLDGKTVHVDTGNVTVASSVLPTGGSTSALQTQISGQLPTTLGQKTSAASLAVVLASDQSVVTTSVSGKTQANAPIFRDYSGSSITTAAYVQLVASTSNAITYLDIFDSSGQAMILATGAAGVEVIQAYVSPGGDQIPFAIPASTRIAYKALTANAVAGYLLFNMYK